MLFFPGNYKSAPIFIEKNLSDEPDSDRIVGVINYDHSDGRIGSRVEVALSGSDDDTKNELIIRSFCALDFINDAFASSNTLVVSATYNCIRSSLFREQITNEAGSSEIEVNATIKPCAHLIIDQTVQPIEYDAEFFSYRGDEFTSLFLAPWLNYSSTTNPTVPAGAQAVANFKIPISRLATRDLRLIVGIEDRVMVNSNDYSYNFGLDSHWIISQIEVDGR